MRDPQTASTQLEEEYRALGYQAIAGLDEVGRGAWAGPLVVGAVILPIGHLDLSKALKGVRDSKKVTTMHQRDILAEKIRDIAIAWGLGQTTPAEIDSYGIIGGTHLAMRRALQTMQSDFPHTQPDLLFLDHIDLPDTSLPQISRARMDSLSLTVAAASLLAKTYRDDLMIGFDEYYPDYDFAHNKGYAATSGQDLHRKALERLGPSPIHRLSFKPMQRRLL
jgi:ribonuclease HII